MTEIASTIGIVPVAFIMANWEAIEQKLARVLPYETGEYSLSDIRDGLEEGDYILWAEIDEDENFRSLAVINMLFFPRKKILNIMIVVSDDMKYGQGSFLRKMEAFARENECHAVRLGGRKGWVRELKKYGYNEPYHIVEKEIRYH